jgi:hypothetical protein
VVDEAAMVPHLEDAWTMAIRPTLSDFRGEGLFGSTPRGLNYFHTLFSLGADELEDEWASWQMPTATNPCIHPDEIAAAEASLPEDVFSQEYLAAFLSSEGAVFRNVPACLLAPTDQTPEAHRGHRVVMGADWGRQQDFTALSVGCADCSVELALDRFNRIEWAFQRARLTALAGRWYVREILAEQNSFGGPNIEALQAEGLNVIPFDTGPTTKGPLILSLALAFEKTEWQWLRDVVARGELLAYEATISRTTGRASYSAPVGMHDDTVIARALCHWQATHRQASRKLRDL